MAWVSDNLQILATLGSALAVYIFLRAGARRDYDELRKEIKEIKEEIRSIDKRLTRIEIIIEEREYLFREHRKTGTEER